MALSINLLKDKYALSEKDYQKEKRYLYYGVVAFVGATVVTLALGLWSIFLAGKLGKIETTITQATAELAGLTEANAEQVYLKSRLELITKFLDNRAVEREALQKVFSLSIPGVVVASVGFEDKGTLMVQMTASDVEALTQAIATFGESTDFFVQVVGRGVTKSQDGSYQVQISLTLPGGKS